ncbi:MAG: hypothetical protein GXP16_14275 [Gammaproteobacteria bacterium]|nr:hypothetical protein [Gammaproteobacteria bacterium]
MNTATRQVFDSSTPTHVAAFQSWRSMKTWVAIWLWYLNVLYWVGFFSLSRPEAVWAVISYLAVGPLIVLMITQQRGLTRLAGLIHVPWVPFTFYLGLRLFSDVLGPSLSIQDGTFYYLWLQLMFWSTLVCIGLDVMDVKRWFAGERYVLGTPAAFEVGASKLAPE